MLINKIGALLSVTLLMTATAFAAEVEPIKEAPSQQVQGKQMSADAKLRLAQLAKNKQQQTAKTQDNLSIKQLPAKEQEPKANAKIAIEKKSPANSKNSAIAPAKVQPPKTRLEYRKVHLDGTPVTDVELAKLKKSKKKNVTSNIEERAFYLDVMLPRDYKEITINGEAEITKEQAAMYIRQNNPNVKLACTIEKLVEYYWQEASREGLRADLALCQAITETGFFKYGGDVVHNQNNFCGLGTTGGGVRGASFKTPQLGVRAHIQHLLAYCRKERPKTSVVDPRYDLAHNLRVSRGVIDKWYGLNGTWAMGAEYCEKIMYHYARMGMVKVAVAEVKKPGQKLSMRERVAKYKKL